MILSRIIKSGNINLRKLFLIDAIGALLSAIFLGVVLVEFTHFFGMPPATLYFLAVFPILFAIYDFYCFKVNSENPSVSLRWIALMNFSYCVLSVGAMFFHYGELTIYGLIYFIVEVIIVLILSIIEFSVSKNG